MNQLSFLMEQIVYFLLLATVVCFAQAKVQLKKGVNVTVAFEGEELFIEARNPQNEYGYIKLCFGSSTDASNEYCPKGYATALFALNAIDRTVRLNRLGELVPSAMLGNAHFTSDGTVNVLLVDMPSGVTVTLLNAEIPVTTTTTTLAPSKVTSNKTAVITAFVTILVVVVVIVGVTVWYFCFCRGKKNQTATVPEKQLPPKPIRTEQQIDNKKYGTRNPLSGITTTRTSTSTTKVPEEKPRIDPAPKPAHNVTASKIHCVSIRSASALESISDSQNR